MNFRIHLLTIVGLLSFGALHAQDQLFKKNGDMLEVHVTEITTRTISYKKAANPDGPSYTIAKGDVSKIIYENDTEDYFGDPDRATNLRPRKAVKYGNNIISVMPMQILTEGVGIGLAYERVLDKAGILSFYLPVAVSFTNFDNTGAPTPIGGNTNNSRPIYYFMPGLKFYPTGSKGVVRYAVGPNLTYVSGQKYDFEYDNIGNIVGVGDQSISKLGIMITNSLNINPSAHIHLGLELGLGFTYMNRIANVEMGTDAIVQFGFKVGYRF